MAAATPDLHSAQSPFPGSPVDRGCPGPLHPGDERLRHGSGLPHRTLQAVFARAGDRCRPNRSLDRRPVKAAAQRAYPQYEVVDVTPRRNPNLAVEILLRNGQKRIERLFNPFTGQDVGEAVTPGFRFVLVARGPSRRSSVPARRPRGQWRRRGADDFALLERSNHLVAGNGEVAQPADVQPENRSQQAQLGPAQRSGILVHRLCPDVGRVRDISVLPGDVQCTPSISSIPFAR